MKPFGAKIRQLREEAKKPMKALATALDVSVVYVSDIERGRRYPPQGDKLHRIANFFNINPQEVEEWAIKERKRVELNLKSESGPISEAALVLARRWDSITNDEANEIIKIFKKEKSYGKRIGLKSAAKTRRRH